MIDVAIAVGVLLVAPLAGAGVLGASAFFPRATRPRLWHTVTLSTLAVMVMALAVALVGAGVLGAPGRREIDLGPFDPARPAAGIAWSIAPLALALLFLAIGIRAGSRLLVGLAAVGLVVSGIAGAQELLAPTLAAGNAAHAPALVLDPLAGLMLAVSVIVGGLIVIYALGYEPAHLAHRRLPIARTPMFLAWLLLFLSAMHLLVLADDLRLLIVGWEVTTLCSFALIGFDGDTEAVTAARRALAYNLAGGIALGLVPLALGPEATVSGLLAGATDGASTLGPVVPLALAGCLVAAAVKSALAPFHPWLLGAMVAAAPVSALLHASAMVKAGSYLFLRLSPAIATEGLIGPAVALLGGVTFGGAALLALRERDLKRILALSTVSSLGLIAASAGLGTPAGLAAGALLLAFHAVAKALAFLVVGAIEQSTGRRDVEALVGVIRRRPRLAGAFLVAAAAMALPPFGLAVAKWAILVLGARELVLVVLLAVGGAASLALWTGVTARLLVRRAVARDEAREGLPWTERSAVGALSLAAVAGLVLAGPVAALMADPAAQVAFGRDAGLAAGWSIALAGSGFAVPAVAVLVAVAIVLAAIVAGRIPAVSRQPYLAGANLAPGSAVTFHGVRGQPVEATSGGFYWGAGLDGALRPAVPARLLVLAGWAATALVVGAAFAVWALPPSGGMP
jgi:ech hydrogenase subunit A